MHDSIISGFEIYICTECGLSSNTISAYVKDAKEFLDFIGTQELTAPSIAVFLNHLRQHGRKSTTIRRKCMSIRCLCHHLISLDRLDPNTIDMIDSIYVERSKPNALEPSDVDDLVAALEKRISSCRANNVRRNVAIILTLYHSGLRAEELCQLNLGDINFTRREIRVKGKGGRDRVVPTTKQCVAAIKAYLHFDRESNTNALFVKSNGQRITRRGISDMLMSLSCRAGVKHTTSHTLRRSCATSLMESDMDLELIQKLLGHQHLCTTEAYLRTSDKRLKEVHKQFHSFNKKK